MKSTLPVKTAETIKTILNSSELEEDKNQTDISNKTFSIVSNPEFLAEGTAVKDLQNPDRVLIGGEDDYSINLIVDISKIGLINPKLLLQIYGVQIVKTCSKCLFIQRISSINSISALNLLVQTPSSQSFGSDTRIGKKF